MWVRTLLQAGAVAIVVASPAAARDLTIVARAGPFQEPLKHIFVTPYQQATGSQVDLQSWTGGLAAVEERAGWGTPWDLVQVSGAELLAGCDQGLFEHLDWNAIGGRDRYLPQATGDCGVGAFVRSTVLTWDRDKFPATPSWGDFWDVVKYPGKRGLKRDVRGNLEIALLADGVAPGDVYGTLRSAEGVDRAFRKLDQLKPYLVFWQSDADAIKILGSGAVLMSSAPNDQVTAANRAEQRHFGIQWAGSLYSMDSWAIVAGSAEADEANRFLGFYANPALQLRLLGVVAYGPTVKAANDKLPADLQAVSPSAPANMASALQVDEAFWRDNYAKLSQRFDEWLAH
ncbi:MAG: extracellular solute-binding protein [Alphaproteobacteria bacterium]|nr:extracellular solute-binding protein [Alphaproteobacteria bacterium]